MCDFEGTHELVACKHQVAFELYRIIIITSTSDLQPSTAIVNELPGQLVSTDIKTAGIKLF